MRLLSVPGQDQSPKTGYDLRAVLYGQASLPEDASIGGALLNRIRTAKLAPAPRAWDLLSIALAVIAADTAARRNLSPDGWTRQLDLAVAVSDPVFWSGQASLISKQLAFLTTDIWRLSFIDGGIQPAPPKVPTTPSEDCVSLLSGGLDSLIGALGLSHDGHKPYLVSQVSQGDKQKQTYFASMIGGGLSQLQLNHNVACPGENERSQRARSFIFLAYGVLLGSSLKPFKEGSSVTLYVCENGYISINPPLTGARLGSLSTKTTHPIFLGLFQQLLDKAGLNIRLENPFQLKTKGEMLKECANQKFLRDHAHHTTSCGRFARNGYKHCGRCLPCLIRRASFHAWGEQDNTGYVFDDLSKDDSDHARFDDVRAAGIAIAEIEADGFDRWVAPSLSPTAMGDITPYKDVVRRGIGELAAFLKAAGVN